MSELDWTWMITKSPSSAAGGWRAHREASKAASQQAGENARDIAAKLNSLEEEVARLESRLVEEQKLRMSLQEDVRQFSTFEQICNSGMLRNFKIDQESDFAQTILSLLKQTMELQIEHLQPTTAKEQRQGGHLRPA